MRLLRACCATVIFWGSRLCDILTEYLCVYVCIAVYISDHSLTVFWHKQIKPSLLLLVNSRWVLESYFIQTLYKLLYRWGYLRASVPGLDWHNTGCMQPWFTCWWNHERKIDWTALTPGANSCSIEVLIKSSVNESATGGWIVAMCFQQMVLLPEEVLTSNLYWKQETTAVITEIVLLFIFMGWAIFCSIFISMLFKFVVFSLIQTISQVSHLPCLPISHVSPQLLSVCELIITPKPTTLYHLNLSSLSLSHASYTLMCIFLVCDVVSFMIYCMCVLRILSAFSHFCFYANAFILARVMDCHCQPCGGCSACDSPWQNFVWPCWRSTVLRRNAKLWPGRGRPLLR